MTSDQPIDVQQFIDARGLSHVQVLLLVLCFLVVALDGFDIAAIGFIASALRTEWGTTPAQLAPLFGAGLFGLMIGAFAFGPLADRLGAGRSSPCGPLLRQASPASAFAPRSGAHPAPVLTGLTGVPAASPSRNITRAALSS